MEISVLFLLVLFERARPDLHLRRVLVPVPRPALPVRVPVPVALAGLDARRWALRLTTVAVGYAVWHVYSPALSETDAYDGVNALVGFYLAFLGLLLLAIVAATGGRDRGDELLAALPATPRSRVLGWVTLIAGLALLEYAVFAGLRYLRDEPGYVPLLPNAWELAQGPLMLLGGGLLGLVLARNLPAWVATPVGVVLGIVWVGLLSNADWSTAQLAPMYEWIQYRDDELPIYEREPGSFAWHNAYLLGLCGLGVVAALLREPGRRAGLLVTGTVLAAGTALAGGMALP
jgi:hypothetical protein